MKRLTLILLLISTLVNAQEPSHIKDDAYKHYTAGFIVGGVSDAIMYDITGSKFWSFVSGNLAAAGVGILKESLDPVFSARDLRNTILGSLTVTFTIRIIIGKAKHKKHFTIEQLVEAGY